MVLQRLRPWSTCRTVFGSAETALWGELSGPRGKGGRLTSSPWERMAFVTVFASLRLPVKKSDPVHLSPGNVTPTYSPLFLQIPGCWGLGLLSTDTKTGKHDFRGLSWEQKGMVLDWAMKVNSRLREMSRVQFLPWRVAMRNRLASFTYDPLESSTHGLIKPRYHVRPVIVQLAEQKPEKRRWLVEEVVYNSEKTSCPFSLLNMLPLL